MVTAYRDPDPDRGGVMDKIMARLASGVPAVLARLCTWAEPRSSGWVGRGSSCLASLRAAGFVEVKPRVINTLRSAPQPGEFCGESMLGTRKADIIVGLWGSSNLRWGLVESAGDEEHA